MDLQFEESHGRCPDSNDEKASALGQTPTVLDAYKSEAAQLLAIYAIAVTESQRPEILKEALTGSFWRSFWPSLVASIVFAGVIVVFAAIAALNGIGLPITLNFNPPSVASP